MSSITRAQFLRGGWGSNRQSVIRPPWSKPEELFVDICNRCGACIDACPEKIVVTGSGKFPIIDFQKGECTFCHQCADACQYHAFESSSEKPWSVKAQIQDDCLSKIGVVCQSCSEVCEHGAIEFSIQMGGVPSIELNPQKCTGCGACVAICPKSAIKVLT
ncbi:MAG: ferredoxin-type protein NapF [Candidatus Thioglobus sp.]|uniref:ferredoxin-type protein NapF n=1 Tax=Candidatus Thioglobus sp. TaxID=2026721 RepID=UPI0001BAC559|nr:ferredoxin-type protein NapF [Candidatus Thioglobus sp.]ACX30472.1 iron-sulfur cluster-binding protein NapF [uncultured Candidatus Thioglobus sp.]EEZ79722.1 MAG: ferredoxin-type protein NapF [uncultured Candidatus Thioglobus sp.]MBT3186491.1 ferredoxin-type protein NapF [Candidatus Thioglobus sp.]MBT3431178.1 ferredoxin-type protein NapF [Candidatus Thioglobus sp.]MBT3965214.1 ferredoxin-type protein NapF [Candidatus Thioglobus sp.]